MDPEPQRDYAISPPVVHRPVLDITHQVEPELSHRSETPPLPDPPANDIAE